MNAGFGRVATIFAGTMLVVGLLLQAGAEAWLPSWLDWIGRLPGDVVYRGLGFRLTLPFASCALLSLGLTLVADLWDRVWGDRG